MIYLIGGNGAPNYGDELIVKHWIRYYREIGYEGPITVDGKGARGSRRLLRDSADVKFVSFLKRHAEGLDKSYAEFAELGREFAGENAARFSDVKLMHFCGGGYLSANWRNCTRLLGAAAELKRRFGFPLVATGLGLAPFRDTSPSDRTAWNGLLGAFEVFECRDQVSYDQLVKLTGLRSNLSWGLDDCFLHAATPAERSERHLHISAFKSGDVLGPGAPTRLRPLMDEFDRVVFWVCNDSDVPAYKDFRAINRKIVRYDNEELLNGPSPIAPQDFMVTARYHPHLMSARLGVSGYFAANSGFYRAKHRLVGELGSPFRQIEKGGTFETFQGNNHRMLAAELGRVEDKRRVAQRVTSLLHA
jgi:hypothetical protein